MTTAGRVDLPVTKYRTRFYTVNVPVTNTGKKEDSSHINQKGVIKKFLMSLNAKFNLSKDSENINYSKSFSDSDEFHSIYQK